MLTYEMTHNGGTVYGISEIQKELRSVIVNGLVGGLSTEYYPGNPAHALWVVVLRVFDPEKTGNDLRDSSVWRVGGATPREAFRNLDRELRRYEERLFGNSADWAGADERAFTLTSAAREAVR